MPKLPLRIVFAGSGEFGLPALKAFLEAGHEIVRVYSQPDRPAGRGRALTPTPIAQFALQRTLPLSRTPDLNAEAFAPADLLVVIAFGQKISKRVADHCRLGSVNLHASKLPKYRGAAPINWAILRGETATGNSIIRLAERMDAGAVLGESSLDMGETETAGELHDRLALDGAPLILKVATELAEGRAVESPQDDSLASSAPKLSRQHARIDWGQPAVAIARQVRGLYPWPGCRIRLISADGRETARLTLARAKPASDSPAAPGLIDSQGHIGTGDGTSIEILEVQPEGKRVMSLADFHRGHAWDGGMRAESIIN